MAELAERTEQDIERLRDSGDRLSRRAVSLEKEVAVLNDRVAQMRVEVARGFAMVAMEGRLREITDIVHSLQSNAYGENGSVMSTTNLLLAGNQLFWTLLDPVLRQSGALTKSGSLILSFVTPIGSLLTGQLLVGNRQHERFISGVSTSDATGVARETLRGRIAEGEWETFRNRRNIVVITERPTNFHTQGTVDDGVLTIEVFPRGKVQTAGVRVGWILDTGLGHG